MVKLHDECILAGLVIKSVGHVAVESCHLDAELAMENKIFSQLIPHLFGQAEQLSLAEI